MKRICTAFASLMLLSSCLTPTGKQAPVEVVSYGGQAGGGSTGMHTMLAKDTVYTVSQKYNLPLRDILEFNNLSPPYELPQGYRLKLPPPNEYKVQVGDTLNGLSRLFQVSVNETARMNNLSPPYVIHRGQVLRLPTRQPALDVEMASNNPVPTFDSDAVAGEQTSVPVKVGAIESEALPPPPGMENAVPAAAGQNGSSGSVIASKTTNPPPHTLQLPKTDTAVIPAKTAESTPVKTASKAVKMPKVPPRSGRFMRPVDGKIISKFGPKPDGLHNDGINIKVARGTAVRSSENGVVAYTGNEMAGYGNLVLVRHEGRMMTAYAHMDKVLVKKGDVVKAGQSIGTVGSTGQVESPQLHFEIRKGTQALDPEKYL